MEVRLVKEVAVEEVGLVNEVEMVERWWKYGWRRRLG